MIRVREALPDDFEAVHPLLLRFENPAITTDHWRRMFQYPWPCESQTRGFMLMDDERVVGFFGAIHSERLVAGHGMQRFANLTSWITLPEYRNHSLRLFQAAVSIPGRTLTCSSPVPSTLPLYLRFGFSELESQLRILLPVPVGCPSLSRIGWSVTWNPQRMEALLSEADRQIFRHHQDAPCRQLLVYRRSNPERYCHIVLTRTKGRRFSFAQVLHLSDRAIFLEQIDLIKWGLFRTEGTLFTMIEHRLLGDVHIPWSRVVGLGRKQVVKSDTLKPSEISHLYSEHTILPGI